MEAEELGNVVEAALLAAGRPLREEDLLALFEGSGEQPGRDGIRAALELLRGRLAGRGVELVEVASGYRIQVRREYALRINRLWAERPARYSRALLETLALVAYRQPVTRGEIEEVRGVAVSSSIIKTLLEREWIRVVGHRDVPGHPALYGTTRQFLDYFGLKSLADLPSLAEIRDLDDITRDLFREEALAAAASPGPGEPPEGGDPPDPDPPPEGRGP
jgi:segregation and condensation protein B